MASYVPFPTLYEFHKSIDRDTAFVRAVCGPFGSGKSVAMIQEMLYIGIRQAPGKDNIRRVRFGVIRATYPTLLTAVRVEILKWYPSACGWIKESVPLTGRYTIPLGDGTTLELDLLLLAVGSEAEVEKLRSLNLTGVWMNEPTEISPAVFDACIERVARYPTGEDGECSWGGIILDYNMPPKWHWIYKLFHTESIPHNYKLFMQPPAAFKRESKDGIITYELNPNAENLPNLSTSYYQNMIDVRLAKGDYPGIDQLLCLQPVDQVGGKPVWDSFKRNVHVLSTPVKPIPRQSVIVSIDTSGIHPCAAFWQFDGVHWVIIDELYGDGVGFKDFVEGGVLPLLKNRFAFASEVLAVCDPANARNALTAVSPISSLHEYNIPAIPAPTNDPKSRIEAVSRMLNIDRGGIRINPNCELTIKAFNGGYRYKKLRLTGTVDTLYATTPEKNQDSHLADAIQYGALYILGDSGTMGGDSLSREVSAVLRDRAKRKLR